MKYKNFQPPLIETLEYENHYDNSQVNMSIG